MQLAARADRLACAAGPALADFNGRQRARTQRDLALIVELDAAASLADAPEVFVEFLDAPLRSLINGLDALRPAAAVIDTAAAPLVTFERKQLINRFPVRGASASR